MKRDKHKLPPIDLSTPPHDPAYLDLLNAAWAAHLEPRSSAAPTVVSTFAGCGGSSLGYSMAGYRELLAVEWEAHAAACFRLNFPDVPLYHGDIAQLTADQLMELAKIQPRELDVFDGSPPCQGFSTVGKRKFGDDRNQLFRQFTRLLTALQPRAFVVENVGGMVKGKMKLIFAEILDELEACGYLVHARLLNAQAFDCPTHRPRMIFIGVRKDLGIQPSHPEATSIRPYTVADAIWDLPEMTMLPEIGHVWVDEKARGTKGYRLAIGLPPGYKIVVRAASAQKLPWDRPAPTICKNSHAGQPPYLRNTSHHPHQIRTLSIREMARCQSFPDGYQFPDALNNGMQRIGNSVPPLLARAIGMHLRRGVLGLPLTEAA